MFDGPSGTVRFGRPRRKPRSHVSLGFIALVLTGGAIGFILASNQMAGEAARYHAAPLCSSTAIQGCRLDVQATVLNTYSTRHCRHRSCSTTTYLQVSQEDGYTASIPLGGGSVPSPQFDRGNPVTVEYFDGSPEVVTAGDGTALVTSSNPESRSRAYLLIAVSLWVLTFLFGALAVWQMRRSPRPETVIVSGSA